MSDAVLKGLDMFHVAKELTDKKGEATYETPEYLAAAISVGISPQVNTGTLFADNGPSDIASILASYEITLTIRSLENQKRAKLLGSRTDSNGVVHGNADDIAPYFAFAFRAEKSDGTHAYVWYYKGKFQPFQENYTTRSDQVEWQTPQLSATFIKRKKDGDMYVIVDEDDPNFPGEEAWFAAVYEETPDNTAPTVTVVPADGASAVAVDSDVVWTFSEAIRYDSLTEGNFVVVDSAGDMVEGTLSLSADQKVVTFTPSTAFTSASSYQAIVTEDVQDIAGNHLAQTIVTNFTTA